MEQCVSLLIDPADWVRTRPRVLTWPSTEEAERKPSGSKALAAKTAREGACVPKGGREFVRTAEAKK